MVGLNDRDSGGPGFEDVEAAGFAASFGDAQEKEGLEEVASFGAVEGGENLDGRFGVRISELLTYFI